MTTNETKSTNSELRDAANYWSTDAVLQLDKLEQQRDELAADLKKYGRHIAFCDTRGRKDYDAGLCSCGLDEALAKVTT